MTLNKGEMAVEILADGTVRIETGDMGGVSHKTADDLMKALTQLLGGAVTDRKLPRAQQHQHDHHGHHHHQ